MSHPNHQINYIELPAADLAGMKAFYGQVFGWSFQDWGPSYLSFHGAGIDGGFTTDNIVNADGALVIIHSTDLEASQAAVEAAGAEIVVPIFSFPGGRRFHFKDPSGNVLALWTIVDED